MTLYSTNCPKCNILKRAMEARKIEFKVSNDVSFLISKGIFTAPVLDLEDGSPLMLYQQALMFTMERGQNNG
jgi:hypothetical protein